MGGVIGSGLTADVRKNKEEEKKKRRSRKCFFRFLFGHQKGSGVWGKAPLLLLKLNEEPI